MSSRQEAPGPVTSWWQRRAGSTTAAAAAAAAAAENKRLRSLFLFILHDAALGSSRQQKSALISERFRSIPCQPSKSNNRQNR
ncbi:unnamed protein product [Boreogadus saida]